MKLRAIFVIVLGMTPVFSGCPCMNPFSALSGVWVCEGYNTALVLEKDSYTLYDVTGISCLVNQQGSLSSFAKSATLIEVAADGNSFIMTMTGPITRFRFTRVANLDAVCPADAIAAATEDPEKNFDILWRTFAENYAFFALHGVDWNAFYDTFRPRVSSETTQAQLFAIFKEMLLPLDDGHVTVFNGTEGFSAETASGVWAALQADYAAQSEFSSLDAYLADMVATYLGTIRERYLSEYYGIAGNDRVMWGRLNDSTGYIGLMGMEGLGNEGLFGPEATLRAAARIMDRVMKDLRDVNAMVLDLRINGGGYDGVSLAFANRFTATERLAFTKKAVAGAGFGTPQEVWIVPEGPRQFTGKIILLVSDLTASAAEVFTLCMLGLPDVTIVGANTGGGFSDMQGRVLPNGWQCTVSNEIYADSEGHCYEGTGIPPDISAEFPDAAARAAGVDPGLDAAMALLD